MAGVLVAAQGDLLLSSSLEVSPGTALGNLPVESKGSFTAVYEGEGVVFQYEFYPQTAMPGQFTLWHASVRDQSAGINYQAFALEDPLPLVILPILGAVAGVTWLVKRHHKADKSAAEIIRDTVKQANEKGDPVQLSQESESQINVFGIKFKAKSKFTVSVPEKSATSVRENPAT